MGADAITLLADEARKDDAGASSHWQKYHAEFRYADGALSGLAGFGGAQKPHGRLKSLAHRVLQIPFRRMASTGFQSLDQIAADIASRQDKEYGLDALRQTLTLAVLKHKLPEVFVGTPTIAIIGDGFASLASLIFASTNARIVLVNLTKTLLVDVLYFKRAFPAAPVALVQSSEDMAAAKDSRVLAVMAKDYALLKDLKIDLAVNIASMQEMNPATIAGYFDALRPSRPWFYCCNREEKTLPDGTVTRFRDYPWLPGDTIALDGLCPWHQFYYSTRPPFYARYDGPIRHRLVRLANSPN